MKFDIRNWGQRKVAGIALHRALSVVMVLGVTGVMITAVAASGSLGDIFRPFQDDSGLQQSAPLNSSINAHNAFFDPSVGTNGQACVTCHQPNQALSIGVPTIQQAFAASDGTDPLFRLNDTADRPDADVSSTEARATAYKLFLDLGVVRIGKQFKGNSNPDNLLTTLSDFRVEHQDTAQFGPLPNFINDPQHPGIATLSLFRRPLVNTNVNFDSAVLWDGRDSIATIQSSQVPKAISSLLLGPQTNLQANQEIADFMTQVFTDQVVDFGAGSTSALGAQGGVQNMVAMANDPARPCLYAVAFPQIPSGTTPTRTPFTPATCTAVDDNNPHTFGSDIFDAWANQPDNNNGAAAQRAAIVRGQEIFNNAVLTQPPDLNGKLLDVGSIANGGVNADHPDRLPAGAPMHCTTCHASHNLGNNPNPNFIGRIGTDSLDILGNLVATRGTQDPRVANILANAQKLPLYCLRPNSNPTGFDVAPCGTMAGDVKTTDPGRAMVTGLIADTGKFKPPILRNLAGRGPFFHAGTAKTLFDLIDFYDARFQINLTQQQKNDLAAFLEAF